MAIEDRDRTVVVRDNDSGGNGLLVGLLLLLLVGAVLWGTGVFSGVRDGGDTNINIDNPLPTNNDNSGSTGGTGDTGGDTGGTTPAQ